MSSTPLLDGLVLVTLSAALAFYAVAAARYAGTPFGHAFRAIPAGIGLALAAAVLEAVALPPGALQLAVAALVVATAAATLVGAARLFSLASGRRAV